MTYLYIFIAALASATLLPGGSEALLLYYQSQGFHTLALLLAATTGNSLGSFINYILGKYASDWAESKNYVKADSIKRAKGYFDRFGAFALLLSWVPIIGDPITFVAGTLRYNLKLFILLILLAKSGRYIFLLYLYEAYLS